MILCVSFFFFYYYFIIYFKYTIYLYICIKQKKNYFTLCELYIILNHYNIIIIVFFVYIILYYMYWNERINKQNINKRFFYTSSFTRIGNLHS